MLSLFNNPNNNNKQQYLVVLLDCLRFTPLSRERPWPLGASENTEGILTPIEQPLGKLI